MGEHVDWTHPKVGAFDAEERDLEAFVHSEKYADGWHIADPIVRMKMMAAAARMVKSAVVYTTAPCRHRNSYFKGLEVYQSKMHNIRGAGGYDMYVLDLGDSVEMHEAMVPVLQRKGTKVRFFYEPKEPAGFFDKLKQLE